MPISSTRRGRAEIGKASLGGLTPRNGWRRLILTIDEFEIIEQLITDGPIERELLAYLRSLIQTEHWLILALAGLHTLKEMVRDYFEPLYASVVPVPVSFLSEPALRQVIANPADDFPLDYAPDAFDLIYRLTHGQPYLAQLIGHNLVRAFNVERFERKAQRNPRFSAANVAAVVISLDFYEQGSYYFRGLWSQAEQSSPARQTDVLRVLAPHVEGLTVAELRCETRLEESTVHGALATLEQHDVVQQDGATWQYRVELMRRWVMHSMSSSHGATENTEKSAKKTPALRTFEFRAGVRYSVALVGSETDIPGRQEKVAPMSIEYGMKDGVLLWVRNPFDGTVTYFNDIHRKPHAFRHLTHPQQGAAPPPPLAPNALQGEIERVRHTCVFCPGNEAMTMEEVMRVTYGEMYDATSMPTGFHADDWAIRVIRNIIPRVPEECTGGKNESYVIIEDGRHFLPDATGLSDLMWSGALPAQHFYHVLRVAAEVVRRSTTNTAVKSVLIRKHQGRESGASQPHIHIQAIGADRIFPEVERDMEVTARQPHIWQECVELMRELGFHIEEGDGMASHWSPFGKFGRHFEVISLQDWQPLPDIPDLRLRLFAQYTHRLLRALGTAPYDLEIHHGEGIPLHLHLNGRRHVYANIGGTLNSPADVADNVVPPTRDIVRLLARQMAEEERRWQC